MSTTTDTTLSPHTKQRPTHINISSHPNNLFGSISLSPSSSPSQRENPFERPLLSPALTFVSAPSTPLTSPQPDDPPPDPNPPASPPPEIFLHVPPPPTPSTPSRAAHRSEIPSPHDEVFPNVDHVPEDPFLDDEGLTSLEKIYLFARSQATFHRVFILHSLLSFLDQISPLEAVGYVLPLLGVLALDTDEQVKEALAAELVPIMWWFFSHCQIVQVDVPPELTLQLQHDNVTTISVHTFTPILGTLLLSPNGMVGGPTRYAVVEVLSRMRRADEREQRERNTSEGQIQEEKREDGDDDDQDDYPTGLFGQTERNMFRDEILQQVVIGMGRLDANDDPEEQDTEWGAGGDDAGLQEQAGPSTLTATNITAPSAGATAGTNLHVSFAQPQVTSNVSSEDHAPDRHRPNSPDPPITKQERQIKVGYRGDEIDHDDADEQAAVGRLSSMSLMAAVAASGPLPEETKTAFVKEVQRIGRDHIRCVRSEASFALGALAKIVPEEVVECSLLPVFDSLRQDSEWRVRHSALFALPAILSRLTPKRRRSLAIDTVVPLSIDEMPTVRLGVLEALGEVLHTFHKDDGGPPEEILRLFLGRAEDRRVREEQQPPPSWGEQFTPFTPHVRDTDTTASPVQENLSPLESFYQDSARPLICAFNYPAVALTLGRARWGELQELYVALSQDPDVKVRRTLAASLGELAKIIGPDNAQRDLVPVWWDSINCKEDGEVRLKAIECVGTFVDVLDERKVEVAEQLLTVWKDGTLTGWRERQVAVGAVVDFIRSVSATQPGVVQGLLKVALEDGVAGVREAAISIMPQVWKAFDHRQDILDELQADIRDLAQSPLFRNRMTFITCQEALVLPRADGKSVMNIDDSFWKDLDALSNDPIIGVRIRLARFIGLLRAQFLQASRSAVPLSLRGLISRLAVDQSQEVRSFVPNDQNVQFRSLSAHANTRISKNVASVATFSRPPPLKVRPQF